MALIIADRVKETTTTTGTGNISLSGRTFGGFQTFAEAIGDGNTTYYCIQNDSQFEIGLGTYNEGTNTLNRDNVFQSSNNDNKINIDGIGVVFCVVPADRIVYKDADNAVVFPTPFAFKRSDDGDYWQAYSTDYTNRISSFFLQEGADPVWKIGLKTTANQLVAPYYAYISGKDGFIELRGNGSSILSIGDGANEGLQVNHQLKNIIDIRKNGGEIAIQNLDLNSDETTSAKNNSIAYTVFAVESSAGHAADLQTWSVATDEKASLNQYGDFETVGDIIAPSGRFTAIRYSDGSIQTSAGLAIGSGALIDQNAADIITQSGYFQDYIDGLDHTATAVSGWAESYIDQTSGNLQVQIDINESNIAIVSGLIGDADFLPGASGGLIDQNIADIVTVSGALRDSINELDSDLTAASGALRDDINQNAADIATASGALRDSINQNTSDIGTVSGLLTPSGESFDFTSNILTYNNSKGGSFTADLSSLSTFDTSGVSLAYSAGTLTYTNNAGGTFDVDLSSISGDVYAMIVDGAPTTLDTLNEIAAALNDDANIANTLITLIGTTSGNLQTQITSNDGDITQLNSDIATVSGIASKTFTVTASSSTNYTFDGMGLSSAADPTIYLHKGHTYYFDKQTSSHPFRISASDGGSVYQDADGNNIEITGQGILKFEVPQDAPDKLYYYCTSHSSMNGVIYTTADGSLSGYFESRVDAADSNISSNSSSITANSGYFESRVDQADEDITTVSGLLYGHWTVSDGVNSENIYAGEAVSFSGVGGTFVSYDNATNIVSISGASDPTGVVSGIAFFGDDGVLTGNGTLTYDGQNIEVDGYINASGERVITSPDIHHIVQLTQAEYDAITPDSATFYIITDASEDAAISGYFESRVDQADADILTVSGLLGSAGGSSTGVPSGIGFFDDSGSISGNNTFIYDGVDVALSGNIVASGKRVITSDEIYHIKQLTQAEYDALTPDPATFYIITDSSVEGPIQYPIRTVYSDTAIQLTDYSLLAGSGLNFTLPTSVGNRGTAFNVKNIGTGTVVVSGIVGQTIDGQTSVEISTQYQSMTFQSDNSNWVIV